MATANQQVVRKRARALRRTANAVFSEAIESADEGPAFDALLETINSNSAKEDLDWITDFAQVTRWDGEREAADFRGYGFTIDPKKFEVTMKISADDLADERLQMYTRRIRQRADAFGRHKRQMVAERLANSFSATSDYLAYDQKAFFSTDHPIYTQEGDTEDAWVETGTQRNIPTSDLPVSQFKLAANYKTARAFSKYVYRQMRQMRADNGVRINANPDTIVVPSQMEHEATELFDSDVILDETTGELRPNPASGNIDNIVVEDELDAQGFTDGWFLFDTSNPVLMPMIYLLRQQVQQDSLTEDSETAFFEDTFYYGADARYDVHFGHYQAAIGSDGSGGTL